MADYSYKYPLLNNKVWLKQKYIVETLSTTTIAKLAGAKTANSARQALLRYGIPLRSVGQGLTVNRDDDFVLNTKTKDVIEGCLLGDAHLRKWNKASSESCAHFSVKHAIKTHTKYVAETLSSRLWNTRITQEHRALNGKVYTFYVFRTLSQRDLNSYFDRWYPKRSERTKIVPRDLNLTPTILLHWFMDDGSTSWRNRVAKQAHRHRSSHRRAVVFVFCSESFSRSDQKFLCKQLAQFGIGAKVVRYTDGTGWRIQIHRQADIHRFFEVVGPCPVKELAYKWKLPTPIEEKIIFTMKGKTK